MKNATTNVHTNHVVIYLTMGNDHCEHHGINEEVDSEAELQLCIEQDVQQEVENQRCIKEEMLFEAKNLQCMEEEEEDQCGIQAEHECPYQKTTD